MNSYNDIDGIPATANRWLLTDLLRGAARIQRPRRQRLRLRHDAVPDVPHRADTRTRRRAGTGRRRRRRTPERRDDQQPASADRGRHLSGRGARPCRRTRARGQSASRADPEDQPASALTGTRRDRSQPTRSAQARAVAGTAITLLANDGILPLSPGAATIAVVGPAADELRIHFGAYSSVADTELPIAIARIATGQVPGVSRVARRVPRSLPDAAAGHRAGVRGRRPPAQPRRAHGARSGRAPSIRTAKHHAVREHRRRQTSTAPRSRGGRRRRRRDRRRRRADGLGRQPHRRGRPHGREPDACPGTKTRSSRTAARRQASGFGRHLGSTARCSSLCTTRRPRYVLAPLLGAPAGVVVADVLFGRRRTRRARAVDVPPPRRAGPDVPRISRRQRLRPPDAAPIRLHRPAGQRAAVPVRSWPQLHVVRGRLFKSDKTDHMAMHKGAALKKLSKSNRASKEGLAHPKKK